MTKEIKIGGNTYAFTANGATPLFYKEFFKNDLLQLMQTKGESITIATENIPELAFIMHKQAENADMMKLTRNDYIEFLSQFAPMDLTVSSKEIFMVYLGDSVQMVEPKKKAGAKLKG